MRISVQSQVAQWIDGRVFPIVNVARNASAAQRKRVQWGRLAFLSTLNQVAPIFPFCCYIFGPIQKEEIDDLIQLVNSCDDGSEDSRRVGMRIAD